MKLIETKDYTEFELGRIIEYNLGKRSRDIRFNVQLNVTDNSRFKEFIEYLHQLQEYEWVDQIDYKKPNYFGREKTDLPVDHIYPFLDTGLSCGIKAEPTAIMQVHPWEKWENGFIEGFIRVNDAEPNIEYYYWCYIRMGYLNDIVSKFKDCMEMWDLADVDI